MPPYVVYFRGFPACPCLAEWLPVYEIELRRRGVLDALGIAQLIGDAPASQGIHKDGGAFDIWQTDPRCQEVAREMGAAAWNRFFSPVHTHGVLNGCPHNTPARYQIGALAAGFNGLGTGGRGGPDTGPGPRNLRTWRDGIAWAREQGDELNADEWQRLEAMLDRKVDKVLDGLTDAKIDTGDGKAKSRLGALLGRIAKND